VVWLGRQVSSQAFSRLLCCAQQPPLRLEGDPGAQGQLAPPTLQWQGCISLGTPHFRALCGLSAPRLQSLLLASCEQLTDDDTALLVGACPGLIDLKLVTWQYWQGPALG
jgi:hypothetical protein